jgi:hypothetical protein
MISGEDGDNGGDEEEEEGKAGHDEKEKVCNVKSVRIMEPLSHRIMYMYISP